MPVPSHHDILKDIESLVTEELQVVSFKWLCRHYDIPAATAKQLLFNFVEQNKSQVNATYLLAGWSKQDDSRHIVQLVGQKALQSKRTCLKTETSLHVYSVQPSQPKDPAELWNTDSLQAKQLFEALLNQQASNCLSDNRHSAIRCSEVTWDPAQSTAKPKPKDAPAPPPTAGGKAAAMRSAVDKIVSGKALQERTGGAASVAVDDDADAAKAGASAVEAPSTTANAHAADAAQAKPLSGAAKRTALAAGSKHGSGNSGLAAMWSKAPNKKEAAPSKADAGAPAQQRRAADANDALRNAAQDEQASSSEEDDAPVPPPRRVVRRGNNSRRIEEESSARDEEDDIEVAVDEASKPSSSKQGQKRAGKRNVLEESSDDDGMDAPPAAQQPSAQSYQALTEEKENKQGSKLSAKKRGRPSKASKEASQDAPGGTDLNGDDDADHAEDQGTDKALSKRQRRGKPEPKYGSVKASDAPADGVRRRKVLRTTYNDKGEEVTELVWEEDKTQSPSPEAEPPTISQQTAEKPCAASTPAGKGKATAAEAPAAKGQNKLTGDTASKKASKAGSKVKGGPGQKGIQSFFARK